MTSDDGADQLDDDRPVQPTAVAPGLRRFGPRELLRAAEIGLVLWSHVAWAVAAALPRLGRADRRRVLAEATSRGVVDALVALGPTFVKFGQMIASSPGMFPATLADACLRTLDDVDPYPGDEALAIVEEDLGAAAGELFAHFDPVPLASASIAQVHACELNDGRHAVLKVQRPDITAIMNRDLRILYRIARLVDRTERGHLVNMPGVVEDMHQVTNEELNFTLEAHRQGEFRAHIGDFGDNKWITAPEVYWDRCGPRVICMERLYGTPMDRFEELRRRGVDGELVLRRGVKVWMEAALVHGPFHGDVHAGNLWVLDDGRAAYLDFGIMGELPPPHRRAVLDVQYTTMIDRDYTRIVRAWRSIGILPPDTGPEEEVAARLQMVIDPMLSLKLGEVSVAETFRQQLDLQHELGARAARELVLMTKQMMYFERYAKELAPDYNMSGDLFLVRNIFPAEVQRLVEERGLELPDDSVPNVVA
jgi:predicted unusual protein kinase regulating ubiquinone biosynthesis (AarF/ABC1/UbiB family)